MNGDPASKRPKSKKSGIPFDSSEEEEDKEDEIFENRDYEKLINRPDFKNADTIIRMDAKDFNMDFVHRTGLRNPIVFTGQKDVLGIKIPTFSYREVLERVPFGQKIDMFNHSTEKQKLMSVATIVSELGKPLDDSRSGPFNMLSLECSSMEMSKHIDAPELVRNLDWAQTVFPKEKFNHREYSKVEKYILMTMAKSYTEFHIDFGGTSVWYHVQKGEKHFFLIEPDENNFRVFEEWLNAYRAGTKTGFFGDVVQKCAVVKMEPGQTLILPAGWIHAVYTPVDSLVYGGNFLFEHSIPMQIQVREYESRSAIRKKFTYPFYEQTLWYFAADFVKKATNRDYVRLIHSDEYEDMIVKARQNPFIYCYNVELEEPDFYNLKKEEDPTQLTFDSIDERTSNDPPAKFNDDFLLSMTRGVWKNLYKVKGLLQRECDGRKQRRGKVAEGIRRPKHLLADFGRIIDYIMNELYERPLNASTSSTVKSETAMKVEEAAKLELIECAEAALPAQLTLSHLLNTRLNNIPPILLPHQNNQQTETIQWTSIKQVVPEESKSNGKKASISPKGESKSSKEVLKKAQRKRSAPKEPKPRKQSASAPKPPPKYRREEHLPLPSSAIEATVDNPVFAAVPLGRSAVHNQQKLKGRTKPAVFSNYLKPVSSIQPPPVVQPAATQSRNSSYNNGSASYTRLPEPSAYNSAYEVCYDPEPEPEFYSSAAIPCVPSASINTLPPIIETYRPSVPNLNNSTTYKSQPTYEKEKQSFDDEDQEEINSQPEPVQNIKASVQAFEGLLATVNGIDEFDDD
ncbi:Transcription factor jumonji domain containing protein [Aphelenchoides bicaudatus]|nr:Transcription factor jumonji domain containing protein [Aphelenchoides bicaudatus]